MKKYFNFNNEVDRMALEVNEETGEVSIPGENGTPLATYESMQQFAEFYAQARDVKAENLKNWELLEHGDVVSFVLRVGTAGVAMEEITDKLEEVFTEMREAGQFHPIELERARQALAGQTGDAMAVIAAQLQGDISREIYDRLDEKGAFTEPEPEPEDTRSDIEKYLDGIVEHGGTLVFFSYMLSQGDCTLSKEEILDLIAASTIPYTVSMLDKMYNSAVEEVCSQGINVDNIYDALLVITQAAPNDARGQVIAMANVARREEVNLPYYTVGMHHIRKETKMLSLMEVNELDVCRLGNIPVAVVFDASVDEELEEERSRKEEEAAAARAAYPDDEDEEGYDEDDDIY